MVLLENLESEYIDLIRIKVRYQTFIYNFFLCSTAFHERISRWYSDNNRPAHQKVDNEIKMQ